MLRFKKGVEMATISELPDLLAESPNAEHGTYGPIRRDDSRIGVYTHCDPVVLS